MIAEILQVKRSEDEKGEVLEVRKIGKFYHPRFVYNPQTKSYKVNFQDA